MDAIAPRSSLPQPIPYQGSKRLLASRILAFLPEDTETLHEPFVGSGAVSVAAAFRRRAERYVLGDTLAPLVGIWALILADPQTLCEAYEALWEAQHADPRAWYQSVRDRFNVERQPAQLLYLLARCVKNAVRFNREGLFNQSPDNRRLGTRPSTLRARVQRVHALLAGRAEAVCRDYAVSLARAGARDVVYLDPPYMGVSEGRDARYHETLDRERLLGALGAANERGVSYLVSFDGRCGDRTYGPPLPESLGLERIELSAGRSSQSTLCGRAETTFESLYLSAALGARLGRAGERRSDR